MFLSYPQSRSSPVSPSLFGRNLHSPKQRRTTNQVLPISLPQEAHLQMHVATSVVPPKATRQTAPLHIPAAHHKGGCHPVRVALAHRYYRIPVPLLQDRTAILARQ